MSGKIDYNEIDRAVLQASKPKASKATKTGTQDLIAQKQSYPPRTRYMDFIARPRRKASTTSAEPKTIQVNSQPTTSAAQTPRRVARFAPASAGMPNYRIASSHAATKPHSIPTNPAANLAPAAKTAPITKATSIAKPTPVTKPVATAKPISATKPVAHVARPTTAVKVPAQPTTKAPAIRKAVAKPETALDEEIQIKDTPVATVQEKAPSSPNANNYSLGVKSPFIRTDAKVEKRPLGNAGSEYVSDDRVEKTAYKSGKEAIKPAKSKKKTKVVAKKQTKPKGWIWPMIIVLIIAAGGGLGYLAYRILENAF